MGYAFERGPFLALGSILGSIFVRSDAREASLQTSEGFCRLGVAPYGNTYFGLEFSVLSWGVLASAVAVWRQRQLLSPLSVA